MGFQSFVFCTGSFLSWPTPQEVLCHVCWEMPSLPRRELRQVSRWFCPSTPGQRGLSYHTGMNVMSGIAVGRDQSHFFSLLEKGNSEEKDDLMWVTCLLALTQPKWGCLHGRAGVCTGGPGNKEWNRELSWGTGGCLYSLPCLCLPFLHLQAYIE